MAVTKAKKSGQGIIAGVGAIQQYDLTLDDSWLAAGEALDLTDDFYTVDSVTVGGQVAATGVSWCVVIPASDVAITASNVKLLAYNQGAAAGLLTAVADAEDLSGVNPLTITVIGKPAVEA